MNTLTKKLSKDQQEDVLNKVANRFAMNHDRHPSLKWEDIKSRLEADPGKLWSLYEMERTGGEPDVIDYDSQTDEYVIFDCSPESPAGRRSLCYDREAWESRKENKPEGSAIEFAEAMGVHLLTGEEYRRLQQLGKFDTKTSSWIVTPSPIRKLGGSLFGDRRYDTVFTYHNGASSYYAARGFRGSLRV